MHGNFYFRRNPNVGYCQGMNFIVGILLSIGLSEHEAFWVMVQIVEKYLPIDYFSVMSGVMVDQEIFTFLIKLKLPKMYRHMRRLEVDPSHFSVQWFVCIFAYNLSRDVVIRLWDIFFVEGCCFLFKVAMAIMTLAEKPMISLTDSCKRYLDDALSFMDKFTKSIKTPSKLIKLVQNSDLDLTDYKLSILRRRFRPNIDKEIDSKLKSVIETSPKENKEFIQSLKIPCKNHDECRYRSRRTSSYFIFNSSQFQIVENYLDSLTVLPYFNTQHLRDSVPTTLLGHKNHLCSYESLFSIHETEDKETNSHE